MKKTILIILALVLALPFHSFSQWREGAGISGGSINCLVFDSNNNLYAGTYYGVYKSTDEGTNWTRMISGLDTIAVPTLSAGPSGEIYATAAGKGIYKSTDGGSTWTASYRGRIFGSDYSLYVLQNGYVFSANENGQPMVSKDNGATWNAFQIDTIKSNIRTFFQDKNGIVYAGLNTASVDINNPTYPMVYSSTDNGNSWKRLFRDTTMPYITLNRLLVDNNNYIYIGFGSQTGVMRSTDNGTTWKRSNNNLWSRDVNDLAVNSKNEIFAATNNAIFRTKNSGDYWEWFNNNNKMKLFRAIAFSNSGLTFAGTNYDGVVISTNNGETWTHRNKGINLTRVTSICGDKDGYYFAATDNNGIFRSTDEGVNWDRVMTNRIIDKMGISADGFIYAAEYSRWGLVIRSTDKGYTWREFYKPTFPVPRVFAGVHTGLLLAGTATGLTYSADKGETYQLFPTSPVEAVPINDIKIKSDGSVYLLSQMSGFYKSTNQGATWEEMHAAENLPQIEEFIFAPDGTIYGISGLSVFKSVDDGRNWTEAYISDASLSSIVCDANGILYVGTSTKGVYRSEDNGNTWSEFNLGLRNQNVNTLYVTEEQILVAGTNQSTYYYTLPSGIINSIDEIDDADHGMFPNPVSNDLYLNDDRFGEGISNIEIYGTSGLKLDINPPYSLDNGATLHINTTQLTSGAYMCRVMGRGWTKEFRFIKY